MSSIRWFAKSGYSLHAFICLLFILVFFSLAKASKSICVEKYVIKKFIFWWKKHIALESVFGLLLFFIHSNLYLTFGKNLGAIRINECLLHELSLTNLLMFEDLLCLYAEVYFILIFFFLFFCYQGIWYKCHVILWKNRIDLGYL